MDRMESSRLMRLLRKTIETLFPWMAGPHHMVVLARVVKVHVAGGKMDEFGARYSVDVQPLAPDGSDDSNAPIVPDVELPVLWAGPDRGIYCLPEVGSIVRLGYYYHDPAQPYIDAVTGRGFSCPDHPVGSLIIQHSSGCRIEIDPDKVIRVITPEAVEVKAGKKAVVDAPVVELAGGGPPVARVGDPVQVEVGAGSSAGTWQGVITGGSERVNSG